MTLGHILWAFTQLAVTRCKRFPTRGQHICIWMHHFIWGEIIYVLICIKNQSLPHGRLNRFIAKTPDHLDILTPRGEWRVEPFASSPGGITRDTTGRGMRSSEETGKREKKLSSLCWLQQPFLLERFINTWLLRSVWIPSLLSMFTVPFCPPRLIGINTV